MVISQEDFKFQIFEVKGLSIRCFCHSPQHTLFTRSSLIYCNLLNGPMKTFSPTGLEDIASSCLILKWYPTPTPQIRTPHCLILYAGWVTSSVDLWCHNVSFQCFVFQDASTEFQTSLMIVIKNFFKLFQVENSLKNLKITGLLNQCEQGIWKRSSQ